MQTRTYGELFKLASALIGTGGELSTGEQDQLSHFINRRFSEIFNASPSWPRYITVGEPRPIGLNQIVSTVGGGYYVYNAGTTEANGLYVPNGTSADGNTAYTMYDSDGTTALYNMWSDTLNLWHITSSAIDDPSVTLYIASVPQVLGDPPTSGWYICPTTCIGKEPAPATKYLSNIGEFVRIHNTQPLLNRSAREYEFYVTFEGAHILNVESTTDSTAWVTYKKEFTPYIITADYYTSTLEVPAEFFNFISHAVYADFLRVQNKQEEALAEEQAAQTFLALELEKIDLRSNNNTINKKFSTYVSRQAR